MRAPRGHPQRLQQKAQRRGELANMQHDGPGFEEHAPVFLQDRHLPEGLQRAILRFVLIAQLEEASPVTQSSFTAPSARADRALDLGQTPEPI
jgi:hypothetical protein